jgi:hypothetical protein
VMGLEEQVGRSGVTAVSEWAFSIEHGEPCRVLERERLWREAHPFNRKGILRGSVFPVVRGV